MKLRHLMTATALSSALLLPSASIASPAELGEPIIALMPHVKELRSELNLNEKQNKTINAWLAEAPAKRKALEEETIAIRAQLRDALLSRAPRIKRDSLKEELAQKNSRLIEMRSLCARMLNQTLNEQQYTMVVDSYKKNR